MGDLHRHGTDGVAWLSCSHVFHADCIGAHPACSLTRALHRLPAREVVAWVTRNERKTRFVNGTSDFASRASRRDSRGGQLRGIRVHLTSAC